LCGGQALPFRANPQDEPLSSQYFRSKEELSWLERGVIERGGK